MFLTTYFAPKEKKGAKDAIYMLLDPFISLKGILFGYKDKLRERCP